MERLGVGPDEYLARNAQLIYGRITGWGRDGPLAQTPGHDINYLALSGALHASGSRDSGPWPALNLVADFGGGGMLLALGVASALFESGISGKGQVRSEEHTSELQSLMRISSAAFCLTTKK